jgi:hypothetical protein
MQIKSVVRERIKSGGERKERTEKGKEILVMYRGCEHVYMCLNRYLKVFRYTSKCKRAGQKPRNRKFPGTGYVDSRFAIWH